MPRICPMAGRLLLSIGCLWAISGVVAAKTPSEWVEGPSSASALLGDASSASTLLGDAPSSGAMASSFAALKTSVRSFSFENVSSSFWQTTDSVSSAFSQATDSFIEEITKPEPCCTMCPCTYGWLESLLLWRNNQSGSQPLVHNLNTDQTLLAANDLRFGMGAGIRAGLGVRDCCGVAWEFNYFGLYGPVATATVRGDNDLRIPGDLGLAVNNFFGVDVVDLRYASTLNNFEVNRVCCCTCCDCPTRCRSVEWLYGFRYLNLHEIFRLSSTDFQEGTSEYRVRTNNNLYGAQLGGRFRQCHGRWSWEGTAKGGIFGNAAQQAANPILDFPGSFLIRPAQSASGGNVAFVGDLNFTGIYQINSTWGLRAGYNLIWIEGVALAPDQLDFTNTPDSGTNLVTSGGVFLQGINLGAEARW